MTGRLISILTALLLAAACVPMYAHQQGYQASPSQQSGPPSQSRPVQAQPVSSNTSPEGYLIQDLEMAVWQGINQQRLNHGLSPLERDGHLADIARAHSQDMLTRNYFSHTTPEGTGTFQQIERDYAGYWRTMGENIITTSGYPLNDIQAMAQHLVSQWMQSPGHRQNILTPEFTHTGIGFAVSGTELRGTQCFVRLEY